MGKKAKMITGVLLILFLMASVYYIYTLNQEKLNREELLGQTNIYEGIKITNIDISGKSIEEAEELIKSYSDGVLSSPFTIKLDNESIRTSLKELGLNIDYKEAIKDAYNLGRSGNNDARINTIRQLKESPVNIDIKISMDSDILNNYVKKISGEVLTEPIEPHIEYTNDGFNIIEGKNGIRIDTEKLINDIKSAVDNSDDFVVADFTVKEPQNSSEMLSRINGVIGEFTTKLGNGTRGRNDNIILSCKLISDRILMPGESISFNDEMGEITVENGYKMASTIIGGKYIDSLGGGLCQTSTTLYNALVRADVEVLERHPHSIAAPYVDPGADGAVWKGSKDLRFKNNWDFPILIKSKVDDKTLNFKIYGDVSKKDYDVDLKCEVVEVIKAGKVIKENSEVPFGQEKYISRGRNGLRVQSYKIYSKDGIQTKKVAYLRSYYPMQNSVVEVGIGNSEDSNRDKAESSSEEESEQETIDLLN